MSNEQEINAGSGINLDGDVDDINFGFVDEPSDISGINFDDVVFTDAPTAAPISVAPPATTDLPENIASEGNATVETRSLEDTAATRPAPAVQDFPDFFPTASSELKPAAGPVPVTKANILSRLFQKKPGEPKPTVQKETLEKEKENIRKTPKAAKKEKEPAQREYVFCSDFFVQSETVEKKEILNFIKGRALHLLRTEDYYYAYHYQNGTLFLICAKSEAHILGKLSVFTVAFLVPGRYVYQDGSKYYEIVNIDNKTLKSMLHPDAPQPGIDLRDIDNIHIDQKIPETLYFQWALKVSQKPVTLVLSAIFGFTVLLNAFMAQQYEQASQRVLSINAVENKQPDVDKNSKTQLPDITPVVENVATKIGSKAVIRMMKMEKNQIVFGLKFDKENEARSFMDLNGGKYENGQVVLAYVVAGNPVPDSRN